jgi:hypothetical protein
MSHSGQILEVAGISQTIEVDQAMHLWAIDDVMDRIRTDKSRAASNEQVHFIA